MADRMADEKYNEWVERGRVHQHAGRPVDAMLCYRHALRTNPRGIKAQFRLGEVLQELGRSDEAVAAWRQALTIEPEHRRSMLALAAALGGTSARDEAVGIYRQLLQSDPKNASARAALGMTLLAHGDEAAWTEITAAIEADSGTFADQNVLANGLASAPPSPEKHALLAKVESAYASELSLLMLALLAEDALAGGDAARARRMLSRAADTADTDADEQALRRLALVAAAVEPDRATVWARRYAEYCVQRLSPAVPVLWPRRNAGAPLRVAYLLAPSRPVATGGASITALDYLQSIVTAHARDKIVASVFLVDVGSPDPAVVAAAEVIPAVVLRPASEPPVARIFAESDFDVLIDLAGMDFACGTLLAQKPARSIWTYERLDRGHTAPLAGNFLPALPDAAGPEALAAHRNALESALLDFCSAQPWFADRSARSPAEMAQDWNRAVATHQSGDADAAIAAYRDVLSAQPRFAHANYLLGVLLRDRGLPADATASFRAALASAPGYVVARVELAKLAQAGGAGDAAAEDCRAGLAMVPDDLSLLRALGLAELARRDGERARPRSSARWRSNRATRRRTTTTASRCRCCIGARRAARLPAGAGAVVRMADAEFNLGVILHQQKHHGRGDPGARERARTRSRARAAHTRTWATSCARSGSPRRVAGASSDASRRTVRTRCRSRCRRWRCASIAPIIRRSSVPRSPAQGRCSSRAATPSWSTASRNCCYLLLYFDVEPEMMRRL